MGSRGRTIRAFVVSVALAGAATGTGLLAWTPAAGAGTVQLDLDCQVSGQTAMYTLPFASRASAWVPEGGSATMAIDPATQTLPDTAPPPLPPVPILSYKDIVLSLVATGGTISNASLGGGGSPNLGPGTPTATYTSSTVTFTIPGPVEAGVPFTPPALAVEIEATAPAGGRIQLVPASSFYRVTAVSVNGDEEHVSCFPRDPPLATTTIPLIDQASPPPPPLPPAPPPSPPSPPPPPAPAVVAAGEVTPLAPQRLLDTRDGTGVAPGPVSAGSSVTVAARGVAGIPADATAVIMNVTATEPQGDGFVTVYPCGAAAPLVSNVNYRAGESVPNLVTVPLAPDGTVCLFSLASAHLVADVAGAAVPSGDLYAGTSPKRLVDTRDGTGTAAGALAAGQQLVVPVAGVAGVPSNATAAVANLTVSQGEQPGFLSAYPCGQSPPNSSNLNFVSGQTVSNLALTRLGVGGSLCIVASAATHVVVDLSGWTAPSIGAALAQVVPTRVVDTRAGGGRLAAGATMRIDTNDIGAPTGTTAVVANVTVVAPAGPGYLTVYPCGPGPPNSSNVNHGDGETRPVLVVAALGTDDEVCVTSFAEADVLVDLQGWFVGG